MVKKPLPTLKVSYYRKTKYYIRHLYGEVFEILVPAFGNLHSHTHQFSRPKKDKRRPYEREELATITHQLNEMAQILIDDIIFTHQSERWIRFKAKVVGYIKYAHYTISELIDKYNERKAIRRASNRHRRTPESEAQLNGVEQRRGEESV